MGQRTALVIGATGVTGTPLTEELLAAGWPVYAVSRRAPMLRAGLDASRLTHIALDLADSDACSMRLGQLNEVTHLFYCGNAPDSATRLRLMQNVLDAVAIGIHKTYYFILQIYTILERMIFTRSLGLESMSGPLGIFDMGGQVARADFVKFLFFMAMISANLAVINFLPLPIVDGGLMVFLLIEKIKGSPVSLRVQVATQMIGLFLIIGIFLFVTYQDAVRMWG